MRLTERQLRLAVREMILREGFLDKLLNFLSGDREKRDKMSGVGQADGPSGFRHPYMIDYLKSDDNEPDGSNDQEWNDWWEENKIKPLKKNAKYVKNLMKELQGILGEAKRR